MTHHGARTSPCNPRGVAQPRRVISLHGAPLSIPTFFDPSFKEFFRIRRAMGVVLPLGNGGVVHLFVIYGYQGA